MSRREKYIQMREERNIKHTELTNSVLRYEEEEELKAEKIFYDQCYKAGLGEEYNIHKAEIDKQIEDLKIKDREATKLKREIDILDKLITGTKE